jgi:hypothetical protein
LINSNYFHPIFCNCHKSHFYASLSDSTQQGAKRYKCDENFVNHDYDLPHPSSSPSFESMQWTQSEIPQDQSLLIHNDLHSYSRSNRTKDIEGHTRASSHVHNVRSSNRRRGGLSSFFMPDKNNVRLTRTDKGRDGSSHRQQQNKSFSNHQIVSSRSNSTDNIGHLSRTPPPQRSRNGSSMRSNMSDTKRGTSNYKRKSFTGSLNSLLDGHGNHVASHRTRQSRTIQNDDRRNQRNRRSPHQSPQRKNRTRSNSRERSFAESLDSLFMANSFSHASPKSNRSRRGQFIDKNRSNFGHSQRSRTRSRSGSRTPPLLPRKGSLKKVATGNNSFIQGSNNNSRHLQRYTRTGSVHFEDAAI